MWYLNFYRILENLEEKEGHKVLKDDAYDCYLSACADKAVNGVEQAKFLKVSLHCLLAKWVVSMYYLNVGFKS